MEKKIKVLLILLVLVWMTFFVVTNKEFYRSANAQDALPTPEPRVYLPLIAKQDSDPNAALQPETPAAATTDALSAVNAGALPSPTLGLWLSAAELAQLPTTGPAWDWLKATADQATGAPDLSDQDSSVNTRVLAKALVYARTGHSQYRNEVVEALRVITFNNTEAGGRTLALGRELVAYVIAADLIDLQGYDAALNTQFKGKLRELLTKPLDGMTLISTHEARSNNWGTHAGASRAAVALYLGDRAELERTAVVFRGYLGDTTAYHGFDFGDDLSWQANSQVPVGVNPLGATKNGYPIDGALPEEMRRGGSFQWPPKYTNYAWGSLQGTLVQAYLLQRAGYPVWQWQDRALLRAVQFLYGLGWAPEGDDKWLIWLINRVYGTTYPAEVQAAPGKSMAWTSWTHGASVVQSTNQPPRVNAGPDLAITLPANAVLNGTVSDDGLPNPPATTVTWSIVSGPDAVTFNNTGAVTANASFAVAGVYVLQLSASDGQLTSSDTVAITVNAPFPTNTAPVVYAGEDFTIALEAMPTLTGRITDDGLPAGPVTANWSVVNGPGSVAFANPQATETTVSFSAAGVYTLQLTANDGALTSSDAIVITVNPASDSVTKVQVRVAAKADDAEERNGRKADLTSGDLELVEDGGGQIVGLRFRNLTLPRGALISNAYLQFQTDEATSGAVNLLVQGQAGDNAPQFAATVNNLAARPRTAAAVSWLPAAWPTVGAAGVEQRTPNLAAILQEIVNRPGWQPGNAVVLLISGSGKRTAKSYDGKPAAAPLLYIEYK